MIDPRFIEKLKRFIQLVDTAKLIAKSAVSWETKYDLIFSEEISRTIKRLLITVDWTNPAGSYEEDVLSYVMALSEKAKELQLVLDETKVRLETSEGTGFFSTVHKQAR